MRPRASKVDHSAHERILADAMVDVATELRLADLAELAQLIRTDQEANIADLVNSSSELFFMPGSLRYGLAARCEFGWNTTPTVRLDMEFRQSAVTVFFRLTIGRARAGVEVISVCVEGGRSEDDRDGSERLIEAIAEARMI